MNTSFFDAARLFCTFVMKTFCSFELRVHQHVAAAARGLFPASQRSAESAPGFATLITAMLREFSELLRIHTTVR